MWAATHFTRNYKIFQSGVLGGLPAPCVIPAKIVVEIPADIWYTVISKIYWGCWLMGLLPMEVDILPPSDDRVFKLT